MSKKIIGGVKMPEYVTRGLRLQSGSVTPDVGRLIIALPDGEHDAFSQLTVEAVTSNIDPGIRPENIKNGVDILGCVGTYAGNGQEKTVTPSNTRQVVTPDNGYYCLSKVTVDAVTASMINGLIPENIKKGVPILNVVGTLEGGSNKMVDISQYNTLTAANIPLLIKSAELPQGISSIGSNAFMACLQLSSVTLPSSVTEIGDGAFRNCQNLENIGLPGGLVSLGGYAFYGCRCVTRLELPDTLTTIGERAFSGCGMEELSIPPLVTALPAYMCGAMYNDIGGAMVTNARLKKVYIPASVTSIGKYAFNSQSYLTDIYFGGTQAQWDAITKGSNWISVTPLIHYNCSGSLTG